ncbi:PREDICTED: ankyrin repeat domain-containing protein 40-like [Wasmannia auropunctata]|uniref:ankyrin repeat domain-containing protein 40-like n=1 Tax=Wasmannia auropunctata TaxID=64793 RepID=UPI0005F03250|nr:PREDICTED: ankyrin repeat domain-containing protein 40-like [Wasmannia auropunctata]
MERVLEERLRDKVCLGDADGVQDLLNVGVDINARDSVLGWTALHWACKEGYVDIAALLLKNGADKNVRSLLGETPASICSNQQIMYLLNTSDDLERIMYDSSLRAVTSEYSAPPDFLRAAANSSKARSSMYDKGRLVSSCQDELVLKIRVANTADPDFIEVEILRSELTYHSLVILCCKELDISSHQIQKLRKLPNTRLRGEKDVQRLQNFQEIEVVIDTTNVYKSMQNSNGVANSLPTLPANGYQSISKKDQTILY